MLSDLAFHARTFSLSELESFVLFCFDLFCFLFLVENSQRENPTTLFMGMQIGVVPIENNLEILLKN